LAARQTEAGGGLLEAQAGKELPLDQLRGNRVLLGQCVDRLIQFDQHIRRSFQRDGDLREIDLSSIPASFEAVPITGAVQQNPPHRLGRGGKEVAPAVPILRLFAADQPQVRFVHQGGRLQRLAQLLSSQPIAGELAQFVIHEREQLAGSRRITGFNLMQDLRDVAHGDAQDTAGCGAKLQTAPTIGQGVGVDVGGMRVEFKP